MRIATVLSREVWENSRLDAKFHLDEGDRAFRRVMSGQWDLTTPGEVLGANNIWMPNRCARVPAQSEKYGKAILVPYDLFRYFPASAEYISESQVANYEQLLVQRGWLLLTRSGRNLGPLTIVDSHCAQFVVTDDMVRISCPLDNDLLYLFGFLRTSVGQALIRRDRNGSVIDHIGPKQVAEMNYPRVTDELRTRVARGMRSAFTSREGARTILGAARSAFVARAGLNDIQLNTTETARRFSVNRSVLRDRLDAEAHAPIYEAYRKRIRQSRGTPLSDLAEVFRPPGRYKTLYVDEVKHGIPLLSGRQIAQYIPIGLKHMSPAAFADPDQYRVKKGMILLTADGRAEENLADTVMVTAERDGWMASGHVHRLIPRKDVHPGLVYLAASCEPVQAQLKSLATGSVVDALNESDVGSVLVPAPGDIDALADEAARAWTLFAQASQAENEAVSLLEKELLG